MFQVAHAVAVATARLARDEVRNMNVNQNDKYIVPTARLARDEVLNMNVSQNDRYTVQWRILLVASFVSFRIDSWQFLRKMLYTWLLNVIARINSVHVVNHLDKYSANSTRLDDANMSHDRYKFRCKLCFVAFSVPGHYIHQCWPIFNWTNHLLTQLFSEYAKNQVIWSTFPTKMFYGGVPDFATDCPCGVWCRVLTTCLLYVGPRFENLVWNDSGFVSLTKRKTTFCCFWLFHIFMPYNMMILYFRLPYFHVSNSALSFT